MFYQRPHWKSYTGVQLKNVENPIFTSLITMWKLKEHENELAFE